MHKQLEDQFLANDDVVFMYIQTVFEGSYTNTFENGIVDLDDYSVKGIYGFDPGAGGALPATMTMFQTNGTPFTIIIDKNGQVVESDFTRFEFQLRPIIENALL